MDWIRSRQGVAVSGLIISLVANATSPLIIPCKKQQKCQRKLQNIFCQLKVTKILGSIDFASSSWQKAMYKLTPENTNAADAGRTSHLGPINL